jgi:cell division cycle 20-like protein 1 (cofactor of APC complex)
MFGQELSTQSSFFHRKRSSMICEDSTEVPMLKKNSSIDDRFIPSMIQQNIFDLYQKENHSMKMDEEHNHFNSFLKSSILKENCSIASNKQIKFMPEKPQNQRKLVCYNNFTQKEKEDFIISPERQIEKKASIHQRKIKETPFKILDAPALQDDFYFNIVDWSQTNFISIGLLNHVYTLNASTNKSFKLTSYYVDNLVSAIESNNNGSLVAVATTGGKLDIFDFEKSANIKSIQGHSGRIGAIAWKENIIASGSRDSHIMISDIRSRKPYEKKLEGHKQEICGLSFNSYDWNLASGGNDNKVLVWDVAKSSEVLRMSEHTAAVKALSWSTHQNGLLASGGGSTDKTIKLWNTKNNTIVKSVDTGSQVCCLKFSKSVNELISTHGFSQNQVEVWKAPEMERIATLTGHTQRVLYLDLSPNGEDIVTASADETLRFWKVFPSAKNSPNIFDTKMNSIANCMGLR